MGCTIRLLEFSFESFNRDSKRSAWSSDGHALLSGHPGKIGWRVTFRKVLRVAVKRVEFRCADAYLSSRTPCFKP